MLWSGGLVAGGHADHTNYPQPCDHQEPSYRRDSQRPPHMDAARPGDPTSRPRLVHVSDQH